MAEHRIVIGVNTDGSIKLSSSTPVRVRGGDKLIFATQHRGENPPEDIRIDFQNEDLSTIFEESVSGRSLTLAPNASTALTVNTKAARQISSNLVSYTVQAQFGASSIVPSPLTTTPGVIIDDED